MPENLRMNFKRYLNSFPHSFHLGFHLQIVLFHRKWKVYTNSSLFIREWVSSKVITGLEQEEMICQKGKNRKFFHCGMITTCACVDIYLLIYVDIS